jgi:DNA-binding transcriptional ArsR family regulator
MGHGIDGKRQVSARERLDTVGSVSVATMLQALATPSRLLILARLAEGPCPAGDLAEAAGMERSACSHQLRLLKNLGLAIFHVEHLRLGLTDIPEATDAILASAL